MVSGQLLLSELSETKSTIGFKVQLSDSSTTTVTSGAGAGPVVIFNEGGFDAVGAIISSTKIV